jgi:hypothetical protein
VVALVDIFMMQQKLLDSFVDVDCPWCPSVKLERAKENPQLKLLFCKLCGLWTHNRIFNAVIDRYSGVEYLDRLSKLNEYYEEKVI